MNHIKSIVEHLNRPPFSLGLSLVSFHTKKGQELLQLVSDVFGSLDANQKKDLREETADQTAARLLEFITVLNYKMDLELADFKDALMSAQPNIVHPLLHWVLERQSDLKTRVHLARFLKSTEVPEQYFADPQIVELVQKHKILQGQFVELHKQLDKSRAGRREPAKLQADIEQLASEKEMLTNKLKQLRKKVEANPDYSSVNFDAILDQTNKLRREQEEEQNLQAALKEQRALLGAAEKNRQAAIVQLQELEASDPGKTAPMQLLMQLRKSVMEQRNLCNNKLVQDIHNKERTLRELERLMTSHPMSQDDVQNLQQDIHMLENDIADMIAKQDAASAGTENKIGFFRDRVTAAEHKKEKLMEEVADLEEEKRETEADFAKISSELTALLAEGSGIKGKTDAEMQEYLLDLKKKSAKYKYLKDLMKVIKDENTILRNTERILRSKDTDIESFNRDLEAKNGVTGFQETQDRTEEVAAASAAVNQNKGQTLDEMSKLVNSITEVIQQRKEMLAPQIKALKATRNEYDEVEADYKQRKAAYDHTVSTLEADKYKLQEEVDDQLSAVAEEIRNVFVTNALIDINRVKLQMYASEAKDSYKERLERALANQETLAKNLRVQRRGLDENRDQHVEQHRLFYQLRALMRAKLEVQKRERAKAQGEDMMLSGGGAGQLGAGGAGSSEANFMRFGDGDEAEAEDLLNAPQQDEVVME